MAVTITDNPHKSRYEAHVDGELAGFVVYRLHGDQIVFVHTETEERFEGHGVGSALARWVLDDARRRGLEVVAACPFIAGYIERHPEYVDLLAG